ncbi:MAG: hypothetical protein JWM14_2353 [Chitinophagaceae bacterium]|nr:hypothetical protein [Chitinophagaceae bacterium]
MLRELNRYDNLGTPKFFHELFQKLETPGCNWTSLNISDYFYNRIVDDKNIFDGCIPLAIAIGALSLDSKGFVRLNPILRNSLINEKYLSIKLVEMVLVALKDDEVFHEIFCSENISYDIVYRLIQIESMAFQFRYANFRQLLISFNFLYSHPDFNRTKLIINSKFKQFFDKELMPEIKKKKIGIEELERMLEQKQIHGKEAEVFVTEYEKKRLVGHLSLTSIEMISEYDVGAGYDVISYNTASSTEYDRFIEVKSYSGVPSFHWSKNEMEVAKLRKDYYYLYLVNRDKMKNLNYSPDIIQNPYEEVLSKGGEWIKQVDSYFITKNNLEKSNGKRL